MISRLRWAAAATVAMLAIATACLADDVGYAPGRGGVGGQVGMSYFRLDRAFGADWFSDYSAGALSRLSFGGQFRYVMSPGLRLQVSPGFTWSAYGSKYPAPFVDPNFPNDPDKSNYLTLLLPVSAQVQWVVKRDRWLYFAGAGPGVYRVWVQNHRKVLKDPVSLVLHRGLYPGATGEIGVERFLKTLPSTSLQASLGGHLVFAQNKDDFVSGVSSNLLALELRVGTNYYFGLGAREKKTAPLPHENP